MMVTWTISSLLALDWSFTRLSVGLQFTSDKNTTTEQHGYLAKEGDGNIVDVLWSENIHREKDVSIKM